MKSIWDPIKQTKFLQTAFVQLSGLFALIADKIDGETYTTLSTVALGIYSAANVVDKRTMTRAARDDGAPSADSPAEGEPEA